MKILGIILILLGLSDIILWIVSGLESGWLEYVVGVNLISMYGAWAMMGIGGWLIKQSGSQSE